MSGPPRSRASPWLLLVTLVTAAPTACLATRMPEQALQVSSSHLRGAIDAVTQLVARPLPDVLVNQQQQHADLNIEYSVDYSNEADPVYASEEAEERAMEQVVTFSTYFPARRQHGGRPCHQQRQQHGMMPRPAAARAVHDAETAVAAAAADGAADADALVSAASQAWAQAQHVASRLPAADAAETAELITELEATMERMAAAEAGSAAAAAAAPGAFDRRGDMFDRGLFLGSALWSELVAEVIEPLRQYVSGLDDYEPLGDDDSFDGSSSRSNDEHDDACSDVNSVLSVGEWEQHKDPFLLQQQGLLPADPAPLPADADGLSTSWEDHSEEFDIGQLLLPEDNAANNLALFGVRTPAEVAAVAAAAAAAAEGSAGLEDGGESSPWSGMLDWLSAAPYLSSFDNIDPQKAAAVLLVGCTLMVFVAFLCSIVDMRNTVYTAAAAAAAAAAGGGGSSHSSSGARPPPAGMAPLRTRAPRAYACSGAAAAAAAMGSAWAGPRSCAGCGLPAAGADELRRPLLVDVQDDLEAAILPAQQSVALAPALQKFYNPLHYQVLPDHG